DRGGRVAFLAFFFGEAKKKVARRGEYPANVTQNNGKPASTGHPVGHRDAHLPMVKALPILNANSANEFDPTGRLGRAVVGSNSFDH
ncbi:hypothetical protein, partial [Zoogloea sp.]|uniref:hypothetical protein n=1 Tax=Zoogloea sp. TaxID=49181 RepID=UPI0025E2AA3B